MCYALLFPLIAFITNDTIRIKIIAPNRPPTMLMPPISGPISKLSALPIDAPIRPAMILPMIPNGTSLPKIAPANQPIIPPTTNVISQPICKNSPLFLYY
ncbi:hypothetical protein SAMN05192557_1143 [Aliicoccus persicus]|uniref:Uncharacterized protein n=1 Tax=Aliicoccus persicus TaxID=930138 RepID=A0A662Z3E5_9STAP|nr:hypothetical protein SAMN05192557_1143 [Aliicoccus persicus]